jgi:pimeloyl-ACP methyl ester carboxylesterase
VSFLTIDDQQIYYEVAGQGPPVLMVMGLGGNSQVWAPLRRFLTEDYTLILYDMRGTGKSSVPTTAVTPDDLVQEIQALLTHLDLDRVQAVGFSFGATVLLNYARQYPQMLRSLSLISGAYEITPYLRTYIEVQTELARTLPRGLYLKQVVLWLLSERFFQKNPEFFERAMYMLERSPLAGRSLEVWDLFAAAFQGSLENLQEIRSPMQIIHGTADKVSSSEVVQRVAAQLPQAQLNWVEGGGHMLTWDAPEGIIEHLLPFLTYYRKGDEDHDRSTQ